MCYFQRIFIVKRIFVCALLRKLIAFLHFFLKSGDFVGTLVLLRPDLVKMIIFGHFPDVGIFQIRGKESGTNLSEFAHRGPVL